MHGIDYFLIALIVLGVVLSVRHKLRHPGCGGNCANCTQHTTCGHPKK